MEQTTLPSLLLNEIVSSEIMWKSLCASMVVAGGQPAQDFATSYLKYYQKSESAKLATSIMMDTISSSPEELQNYYDSIRTELESEPTSLIQE